MQDSYEGYFFWRNWFWIFPSMGNQWLVQLVGESRTLSRTFDSSQEAEQHLISTYNLPED